MSTTTQATSSSSRACPHCGEPLERLTVSVLGRTFEAGWGECPCEGARRERERERAEEAEREEERRRRDDESRLLAAGIPPRYLDATHERAARLADELGEGYYIFGGNGTGKTMLAMAIAKRLIHLGCDVRVAIASSLMESMRSRRDEDKALTSALEACEVMVLDDIGKESATSYASERLFDIINARYNAMAPTIVTSNYTLNELANHLPEGKSGPAIASRFRGTLKRVHMDGKDWRSIR